MPSDCVKNSIGTYRNASKHTMDCPLFVWKRSRSLSLSFQISKHSLPKASFPSRTQDQKVLRSFQRFAISMPRSLQEGSTFMISQGEQAQFLSSARVSWGIWCHVASFQWISPQFCSGSFALNCPTLKNGWKTQCSLYHFIVLGGTKPRFFFQFRCKRFPDKFAGEAAHKYVEHGFLSVRFLCNFLGFRLLGAILQNVEKVAVSMLFPLQEGLTCMISLC